jgi:predicted nucleotidyltransferase
VSEKLPALDYDEEALAAFCRRRNIVELAVFGSAARNEMRPDSDVDVMVTFAKDARVSLLKFPEMARELGSVFGRVVDFHEKSPIRNPFVRHTINRDLTVIYAA